MLYFKRQISFSKTRIQRYRKRTQRLHRMFEMKTGIIIPVYNRPEYLHRCLDSISASRFPKNTTLLLVNDYSVDNKTIKIFENFSISGVVLEKKSNIKNCGMFRVLFDG